MKRIIIPAALILAFGLVSCQSTPSRSDQATPSVAVVSVKPYPLKTCIVTDEDLDSMGGEVTRVHNGQEVRFCCNSCVKKFEANPAKYLAKLQ